MQISTKRRSVRTKTPVRSLYLLPSLLLIGACSNGDEVSIPYPPDKFTGVIKKTVAESVPDYPQPHKPPKNAPNILLIMTDDVGFGTASSFGGPVDTPTFDSLGDYGLRYNAFHTTALSSPTRAALLTGRNHHHVGVGTVADVSTGFPGYNNIMPLTSATVATTLKENGYNTLFIGKNHNTPPWVASVAGPFDQWPVGFGFEYFYGFNNGETHQWFPGLFRNITPVAPYLTNSNYILDRDLADNAIHWIQIQDSIAPDKPFFMYFAPGTAHAPHHAPKEWIAKYKGKFDKGWDYMRQHTFELQKKLGVIPKDAALNPRPEGLPAWDSLSPERQQLLARQMEVYAGALSFADYNIGRVIDALRENGEITNTLIIYIMGDNGASAEGGIDGTLSDTTTLQGLPMSLQYHMSVQDELGGPRFMNNFSSGWASALNAPFQWTKQVASHLGGTRNPMVISWLGVVPQTGDVRPQFHHVVDIAPTLLAAAGIATPDNVNGIPQDPFDGVDLSYTFSNANAPTRHRTQYFEILGNRGIYHDGWLASSEPLRTPWEAHPARLFTEEDTVWELYNLNEDYSQSKDLAKENPAKLKELLKVFDQEARKNNVYPINLNASAKDFMDTGRPSLIKGRKRFSYHNGSVLVPEGSSPNVKNKSFTVHANITVPKGMRTSGTLVNQGGLTGGWGLLVFDNVPTFVYVYSLDPGQTTIIRAPQALTPGDHKVTAEFLYDGGGIGKGGSLTLKVDGTSVAEKRIARTIPARFSGYEGMDVGADLGTTLLPSYKVPFRYNGGLSTVEILLDDTK